MEALQNNLILLEEIDELRFVATREVDQLEHFEHEERLLFECYHPIQQDVKKACSLYSEMRCLLIPDKIKKDLKSRVGHIQVRFTLVERFQKVIENRNRTSFCSSITCPRKKGSDQFYQGLVERTWNALPN
jgi:hypothetical protein